MEQEQRPPYESGFRYIMDKEAAKRENELLIQKAEQIEQEAERIEEEAEQKAKEVEETIARRLLEKGIGVEFVADATGLEEGKVIEIQRDIQK